MVIEHRAAVRTRVYSSILDLLSDHEWHKLSEVQTITAYHHEWVKEFLRDPRFEFDVPSDSFRLRPPSATT